MSLAGVTAILAATAAIMATPLRAPSPASAEAVGGLSALVSTTGGSHPALSGDGRFVVYQGSPGEADGRTSSIWLRDQQTKTELELTIPSDGVRLGNSVLPNISSDGCVVVILSELAFDLFRDEDRHNRWDVYRSTLPGCGGKLGDWELVSTKAGADGQAGALGDADPLTQPAISGSGAVVAYVRPFQPRSGIPDPQNVQSAVEVVDFSVPVDDFGRTSTAAGMPSGSPDNNLRYRGQRHPALSGDGSTVVFSSDALSNDAVPTWAPPVVEGQLPPMQVFAWDRNNDDPFTNVVPMSVGSQGPANADAGQPSVSSDGRVVAFSSAASNLVPIPDLSGCGLSCPQQVYRVDRDADNNFIFDEPLTVALTMVSARAAVAQADLQQAPATPTEAGNGDSFTPAISADGNAIVFITQANNLFDSRVPGMGEAGNGDLVVIESNTGIMRRVITRQQPVAGAHAHPAVSSNGRMVVADSLVAGEVIEDPAITGRQVLATTFVPRVLVVPLHVGTVMVGVPGPEWFVNVLNDGPGSFTPSQVTSNNPDFAVTGGTCMEAAPVPAGKSCSVTVLLTPSVPGPISGELMVAEVGHGALVLTAALSGDGGEPALAASPSGADLGSTTVGTIAGTKSAMITNVSLGPTTVASVNIGGLNPDDFSVTRNNCGGLELGASCEIVFEFVPQASGRRSATAVIGTATGQLTSILLSGEGHYSPLLLADATITAGERLGVAGAGFPAKTSVTINWSDGTGRSTTVRTDDNGSFLTDLMITRGQRSATKILLARASDLTAATAQVKIEGLEKSGPGSASWPGR